MSAPRLKFGIGDGSSTSSTGPILGTDTSVPLSSSTNFQSAPTPGEGMILMDEGTTAEEIAYATGLSSGSLTIPLANRGLEGTAAVGHSGTFTVKGPLTVGMWNDMISSMLNAFVQSTGALDTTKVADLSTAQTFTNKRRTRRLVTVTQSATPAINSDTTDVANITGLAQDITSMTTNLTGTPVDGDLLEIRITDNGTGRAITWGSKFQSTTITLPTTTVASTMLRIGLEWNNTAGKFDCIAVA